MSLLRPTQAWPAHHNFAPNVTNGHYWDRNIAKSSCDTDRGSWGAAQKGRSLNSRSTSKAEATRSHRVLKSTQGTKLLNPCSATTKAHSKKDRAITQLRLSSENQLLTPTLSSALEGLVMTLVAGENKGLYPMCTDSNIQTAPASSHLDVCTMLSMAGMSGNLQRSAPISDDDRRLLKLRKRTLVD